jgi:hypothetical protein
MCRKKTFTFCLSVSTFGFILLLLSFLAATPVYARSSAQDVDNGNCVNCHEDLYFLHDTGNWFCLRESPMRCVDCHGGNPAATTQETAHYDRSAHPIINEDISKCRECHIDEDECCECVSKFDQVAGLKQIKLVSSVPVSSASALIPGLPAFEQQEPVNWLLTLEILPLIVIASLALTIFILKKVCH